MEVRQTSADTSKPTGNSVGMRTNGTRKIMAKQETGWMKERKSHWYGVAISSPRPSVENGLSPYSYTKSQKMIDELFADGAERLVLLHSYPSPGPINRVMGYLSKPSEED